MDPWYLKVQYIFDFFCVCAWLVSLDGGAVWQRALLTSCCAEGRKCYRKREQTKVYP